MIKTDTIAAIATAPGMGGIGIIRMSGPEAPEILMRVFKPAGAGSEAPESHKMVYGKLVDGDRTLDECMAVLMRAPRSYTREDVAEIQLHGGNYVIHKALELCLKEGARLAEAGEFTRRAFLNGAVRQMNGGAASFVRTFSEQLYGLQAGLAACIDYPEEITDEEGAGTLQEGLDKLICGLEAAMDEHASRLIYQGLHVALIGRPNVGKSSLLNALLGEDRAIVTDIPGTTRDTVQGEMMLNGFRVQLTDTAGIRETMDPVEKIGVERSVKARREADASLLIIDGSAPLNEDDRSLLLSFTGEGAVVINKTDLPQKVTEDAVSRIRPDIQCMTVSALDTESLQPLRNYLSSFVSVSEQQAITQPRHLAAVKRALFHLKEARRTIELFTPDVAATDLQAAQEALSEITGDRADEKLLDRVFSQFCVGK